MVKVYKPLLASIISVITVSTSLISLSVYSNLNSESVQLPDPELVSI